MDTYLRFAEAVNRLDIAHQDEKKRLPEVFADVGTGASKAKTKGAIEEAIEAAGEAFREFLRADEQRGAARPARRVPASRRPATAPG